MRAALREGPSGTTRWSGRERDRTADHAGPSQNLVHLIGDDADFARRTVRRLFEAASLLGVRRESPVALQASLSVFGVAETCALVLVLDYR